VIFTPLAALIRGTLEYLKDKYDFDFLPEVDLTLAAVAGALIFLQNFYSIRVTEKNKDNFKNSRSRRVAINSLLVELADRTGESITLIGASIFVPKIRRRLWIIGKRKEFLKRIQRERLLNTPQISNVEWAKGKGAIGQCWETEKEFHLSWINIANRYQDKVTLDNYESLVNKTAKHGLTAKEFNIVLDKYSEILAVPIHNENQKFIGVLSVDIAIDRSKQQTGVQLKGDKDVRSIVATCAKTVADYIRG